MNSDADDVIRAANKAQGLRIKRNNLIAASLSGLALVLVAVKFVAPSPAGFLFGVLVGFVYANGFEYCLHRFLLHCGHGIFAKQHMVHHATLKSPEAARYVNFSSNPWGVVALFFANAIPFLILEWIFKNGWVAGAFVSFALYYMAFEEIHWRSHMGGWLPRWLAPAARHHLRHHADDTRYFNVFLPMFDWIVSQRSSSSAHTRVRREMR
jgi:Fatty acid hydroxylase superfamily